MFNKEEIYDKLLNNVLDSYFLTQIEATNKNTKIKDFDFDEVDYVDIILDIKDIFGINLKEEEIKNCEDVNALGDLIYEKINNNKSELKFKIDIETPQFYISEPNYFDLCECPKAIVTTSANPFHYGHLDLFNKATEIFQNVKVVIAQNSDKSKSVNLKEHMDCYGIPYEIIEDKTIADYCKENNVTHIIRGIRNGVDAEYELKIDFINKEINPKVQTIFIPTSDTFANISSSTIRELLKYKKYDIAKKFMQEDAMWKWIEDNMKD